MLERDALILLYELMAKAEIPEGTLPPLLLPTEEEDHEPENQAPKRELFFDLEVELMLVLSFR